MSFKCEFCKDELVEKGLFCLMKTARTRKSHGTVSLTYQETFFGFGKCYAWSASHFHDSCLIGLVKGENNIKTRKSRKFKLCPEMYD